MTLCILPSDASPELAVPASAGAGGGACIAMGGANTEDFVENPELRVYVEDALRLVLAARPERPLDLIDDYFQSVLGQANVVGREYAYVSATMRNRRAFVLAVNEVFVGGAGGGSGNRAAADSGGASRPEEKGLGGRGGFAQRDVVHLLGLVCPDFPEEIVSRVARILSEGSRYLPNLWLGSSDPKTESASTASGATAAAAEAAVAATAGAAGAKSGVIRTRSGTTPASATDHRTSEALLPPSALGVRRLREEEEEELPIELWSFEVFLRACGVYFCFQDFFEDARVLFDSLAFGAEGDVKAGGGVGEGGNAHTRDRDLSVEILLDQLQAMKNGEPQNRLRYIDVRFTKAAVRRGGIGERVTLPALLACLLIHSHEVASSLLERPPADGYSERLEACPALWSDGRTTPQSAGDGGDALLGRKKKGARKGVNGRSAP